MGSLKSRGSPPSFKIQVLLVLLVGAWLTGCPTRKPTSEVPQEVADVLPIGEKRPLEVVFASPQGQTRVAGDSQQVVVAFNQPMVPLRPVPMDEPAPPMSIEPNVPGRFRWKGTATLMFEPSQPLPYGTHYKVKVAKGAKSWAKQELAADYTFEFTTPVAALDSSIPTNGNSFVGPKSALFLHFNQPMDPAKAASSLQLSREGQKLDVDVRPYTKDDKAVEEEQAKTQQTNEDGEYRDRSESEDEKPDLEKSLVVVPKQALEMGKNYQLTLAKGLVGKAGGVGSAEERVLRFSVYGPLKLDRKPEAKLNEPESGMALVFSNPVAMSELTRHLKIQPAVKIPEGYAEDKYFNQSAYLYLPLAPRTSYTLTIDPDMVDQFGNKLGESTTITYKTGDYSPRLDFSQGIGLLESKGPASIPMGIRNVKSLEARIYPIPRDQIVPFLTKYNTYDDKQSPPSSTPKSISIKGNSKDNELQEATLPMAGGPGAYYVTLHSPSQIGQHSAVVEVTDIGLTAKFSPHNCLIFATSLQSTKALEGVSLELRSDDNKVLWTGKTDAKGMAQTPGWADLGLKKKDEWQTPDLFLIATHGAEVTFMRSENGRNGISPWDFNIPYSGTQQARMFQGYAFTERGLYRPGEKVQLKGSLREIMGTGWKMPDLKEISYKVVDPRDREMAKGMLTLNEFGAFHQTINLAPEAATGSYFVQYHLPADLEKELATTTSVASTSFRVEPFRPAQFEVTVKPEKPFYVMGDTAKAQFKGWFLFGAPMNGSHLSWSASVERADLRPAGEQYDGYSFGPLPAEDGDTEPDYKKLRSVDADLDAQGLADGETKLDQLSFKGSANLIFEGTVTSANRQQLSGRAVVPLHRGDFQLGLKPASFFATSGQPFKVQALAVLPGEKGELVQSKPIKLELVRREWSSVKKADVQGDYSWVTVAKDKTLSSQDFRSGTEAVTVEVKPDAAGTYVLRATSTDDKKNPILTETMFYAMGSEYVSWMRQDGDMIELVPDKPKYKPGDTAHVLIKSPFEKCTALITYERESVLEHKVVELTGSAPSIDVPLTSAHIPNMFVSVALIQGRVSSKGFGPDGEDLGKPAFKIGYADLHVQPDEKHLKVAVKSDKEGYAPGDTVTVDLEVKNAAGSGVESEVCLAAADLGVLNLIGYKTPDYFDSFYSPRPLAVRTAETRMDVIGQRAYGTKGSNQGGGGGELESAARQDFDYTAYWNPSIKTDSSGKARVTFKLPDNLTSFRLMAVAQTRNSEFGSGESKFTVSKPLQLQPSLPKFARVGDDFRAGVVVHNNTDAAATVKVHLDVAGLTLDGPVDQTVQVDPKKEREVLFHFQAEKDQPATLTFQGSSGSNTDSVKFTVPLQRAVVTETVATSASTTDPAAVELAVPGPIAPGTGTLRLNVASTALAGLTGAVQYTISYPFSCLEQRLSRMMPVLVTARLVESMDLPDFPKEKCVQLVKDELEQLPTYQKEGGGLSLWPDAGSPVNDYLTAYYVIAVAKAKAKEQGYKFDLSTCEKARGYLKRVLNNSQNSRIPYSKDEVQLNRAMALYALSLWNAGEASYLNILYEHRDQMPLEAECYLLMAARRIAGDTQMVTALEKNLSSAARVEGAVAYFTESDKADLSWTYCTRAKTTGVVLRALLDSKKGFELAPKVVKWLMEARSKDGHWGNTQANVAVLDALGDYVDKFEKDRPDFHYTVSLGKTEAMAGDFKGRDNRVDGKIVPVGDKETKLPVVFAKKGTGRLYYDLRLTYGAIRDVPARDEGMAVFKTISDVKTGQRVTELKAGNTYKVTLTVVSPRDRRFVVVTDPVPSGVEVLQSDFATESDEMRRILAASNAERRDWTFGHFETYDNRVLLFADGLGAGEHTHEYLVRANLPGSYQLPATKAEEMYHPEIFGNTATQKLGIR